MRILIDIGHPGHVHLFKNFASLMKAKGHEILFTCRDKEFEKELIKAAGFNYVSFGKKFSSLLGKIKGLLLFNYKLLKCAKKFKPDLFLSSGSMYAAHVSFLMRKPHVSLEDTGNMEQVRIYLPFTEKVLIPETLNKKFKNKEVRYKGIHELFYLHPNIINFEDKKSNLGNKKMAFLRIVAWNASHDKLNLGDGITSDLNELIQILESKDYQILISSENELPNQYNKYDFKFPPEDLHFYLKQASLHIGEGATTATEASLLGTPSVLVNPQAKYIGSLKMLQNEYQIQDHFDNFKEALPKIKKIIEDNNYQEKFDKNLDRFISDHIDCTSFLVDFIENNKYKN